MSQKTSRDYRQEYAQKFDTYPHYVAYWHELPDELQAAAIPRFSGENMIDYVYNLGSDDGRPCIICRRKVAHDDITATYARRFPGKPPS